MVKKKNKKKPDLRDKLMGLSMITAMSGGLLTYALGGLNKMNMFGGDIPKGVVREMMEGVVSGIIDYFEGQRMEFEEKNKNLFEEIREKNREIKRLKEYIELCESDTTSKKTKKNK